MKKHYTLPTVKQRAMDSVMLDVNSGLGGTQLGGNNTVKPATPADAPTPEQPQEEENNIPKTNLWDEE